MIKKTIDGIFIPKSGELEYGVSFALFQKDNYKQLFEAVENFYSGNDILDEFIREAHRHTECITYLFMKDREVLAYCSMSCSAIFIDEPDAEGKPTSILHPAIEFRYFAVRKKYQMKKFEGVDIGVSSYIFKKCLLYAYHISQNGMAAEYFVLHAKNEDRVRKFYRNHSFAEFMPGMRSLTDITFADCVPAFLKIPSSEEIYGEQS